MAEKKQNPIVIAGLILVILVAVVWNFKKMAGGRRPAARITTAPPEYVTGPGTPQGRTAPSVEVSARPAAEKKSRKITVPTINVGLRPLTSGPNFDTQPVFSPNGREIAYISAGKEVQNIYILKLNSDEEPVRLTAGNYLDSSPSWSADSNKIIFSSNRGGAEASLFLVDKFTADITALDKSGTSASFSPDGEWLAFADQHNIWRMKLSTKEFEPLTKTGYNDSPAWDKDAKKIYFAGGGSIKVIDLKTSDISSLISKGFNDYPAVSRIDNRIAYVSLESGSYDLWMINEDAGGKQQLTGDEAREQFPSWSPDGASIVFTSDASGPSNLWLLTFK